MIKVALDILARIILSSLRLAQECFKVKLILKSHNRAITRRYGLAIEASYSPEYRSLLSRFVFVYVHKLKEILTFCSINSYLVRPTLHTHQNHATTQQLCCIDIAAQHSLGAAIEISGVDKAGVGDSS